VWGGKSGLHRAGSPAPKLDKITRSHLGAGYLGLYAEGRKVPQKIYRPASSFQLSGLHLIFTEKDGIWVRGKGEKAR